MALITSRITPEFRFSSKSQRFIGPDGRFVARETVHAAGEAVSQKAREGIEEISQRFKDGEITHKEWDAGMRQHIRTLHVAEATLASGGFDNMSPAKYGRCGPIVRDQFAFLNGMGERIQSGYYGDDLSKNGFMAHAKMYANGGRATFQYVQAMNTIEDLGHDIIWNILGQNEHHCTGDNSCEAMTDLGEVTVGSKVFRDDWIWPGGRLCILNCYCGVGSRKSEESADEEQ